MSSADCLRQATADNSGGGQQLIGKDEELIHSAFAHLQQQLGALVLGREPLIERLLLAVLADGHVLLEGPPGVAKTRAAHLLANAFQSSFQRIQFTPDLLPADLTGTTVYDPAEHRFDFHPGPLFHAFILADEINRAPAKVQSALLEAMAERQITVGGESRKLAEPFFVIATQNPIEEEGTYELPAAQLDRFSMRLIVGYPDNATERAILDMVQAEQSNGVTHLPPLDTIETIAVETLLQARQLVLGIHLSDPVKDYIVRLVGATRGQGVAIDAMRHIAHPVSPRGTVALARLGQARAWLHGRDYVTPEDIQALAIDVLGHRLRLSHRAEAQGIELTTILNDLLTHVVVV